MAIIPKQNSVVLAQRVGEVLHYLWDPIGVSDAPEARDEYESYLAGVLGLLARNASVEEIASHLNTIATERMGLEGNPEHSLQVASILLDWNETLRDSHA